MSDYLDFSGDDGDYLLDAFVDGGGFSATEAALLGYGSGAVDLGSYQDMVPSDELMGPPDSLNGYNYLSPNDGVMGPPSDMAGGDPGLLKSAEAWLKANPNIAKLGLSGVAGLASAYSANKAGQNSIESLKEQEAQKLRTRQRVSDSIIGMAPFQVNGAQPLQRLDGTRVFGQDGKIMR